MDDRQLLQRYAADGSDEAFEQLVTRHLNLVYSTARRLGNGDAHFAQDVAQLVFTNLARKAATLPHGVVLAGWLHRDTCFTAREILRKERRRRAREQEAVAMNEIEHDPAPTDWQQIHPLLDDALNQLHPTDRDTLLLRFFEQRSLVEVGKCLGFGESGAARRVARALDKLRDLLAKRGVTTTAAALSVTLTSHAVQIAPAGLAAALTSASLAVVTTATTTSTSSLGILQLMASTKLKLGLAALLATAVVTPIMMQHESLVKLRKENRAFQMQTQQMAILQSENESLSSQVANARQAASLSEAQTSELLRLRGEVAAARALRTDNERLRGENLRLQKIAAQNVGEGGSLLYIRNPYWRKAAWANQGTATARDALQTFLWASANEDAAVLESLSHPDGEPADKLLPRHLERIEGIQIVSQSGDQEDTRADFQVIVESWFPPAGSLPGLPRDLEQDVFRYHLEKVDGQWRVRSFHHF